MFEKYFGKKTIDKLIDYEEAIKILSELEERKSQPIFFELDSRQKIITKTPSYSYIFETIRIILAPYKYKHNEELKGALVTHYIKREFPTHEIHKFEFQQIIDNLSSKNIKGASGKMEILFQKPR